MAIVVRQNRPLNLKDVAVVQAKDAVAWLRDYITAIKHGQLHPYTPLERKAREATRNEAWGPTGTLLNELAEATFDAADCEIIFAVLQMRLGYPADKWRNVYKGLTVLEFLLKRGSEQCVRIAREEMMFKLEDLEAFEFVTGEGRDNGINVRHRAQAIRTLLKDERRLSQEREAFKNKRKTYQGYSRDQLAGDRGSSSRALDTQDTNLHTGHSDDDEVVSTRRTRSNQEESQSGNASQAHATPGVSSRYTPSAANRNAGEMKGVTMEENKKYLAALKALLERPENRLCADCVGGGAASRSSWASINTGVFICMRCAGIHRGLGVHISKVRSCTLDTWLPEQVRFMARTGNARANQYYEAKFSAADKPSYHSPDLETFIRRKYARDYAEGEWPPSDALAGPDAAGEEADGRAALSPGPAVSSASGRKVYGGAAQAGSFWAGPAASPAPAPSPSANLMDEGFGESAFSGDSGFDDIAFARSSQPAAHAAPAPPQPAAQRIPAARASQSSGPEGAHPAEDPFGASRSKPSHRPSQPLQTPASVVSSHQAVPGSAASLGFEDSTAFSPMKAGAQDSASAGIAALFGPGPTPSANGTFPTIVPTAQRAYSPMQAARYSPPMQPRRPAYPPAQNPAAQTPAASHPDPAPPRMPAPGSAAVSGLGFGGAGAPAAVAGYGGPLVPKLAPPKPWSPAGPNQETKSVLEDLFVAAVEGLQLKNQHDVVQIIRPAGPASMRRMASMKEQRMAGLSNQGSGGGSTKAGSGAQVQVDATGSAQASGSFWAAPQQGSGDLRSRGSDQVAGV
ncbi:hypothetical protein WJX72_005017 [[Myrmecia] bisecta]|uniref:Uncharacterized protein n=1 Tax=[Myrmecia] bisecta TaxID=41462 RepID=A0AAW1R6Z6_9CHLO